MIIFVLLLAIFFLIVSKVSSHGDEEIQKQENYRNTTKLLLAESKIREADAYKNALGVSKKIVDWNDTFIIHSFDSNNIRLNSSGLPGIILELNWRMTEYKLVISIIIRSNEKVKGTNFTESVKFYNKSESEIIDELKIIFKDIQDEFFLKKFINLY